MEGYKYTGPVVCNRELDPGCLAGKTAVVTGGANGIGQAYVRALVSAGVSVCFGDLDDGEGRKLEAELKGTRYVRCDVTSWEDQARLFREAVSLSPSDKISFVVPNAGIVPAGGDEVFSFAGENQEPTEPKLTTIDVNLKGTLFTVKLALHYFVKQNGQTTSPEQEDCCLVLIGSGAAYADTPRGPQYPSTKWAVRGIMHSLRRTSHFYGSRVNMISPWYVKTNILSEAAFKHIQESGVQFATTEEAGRCLLHILSDKTMNGHSLFVSGKKWSDHGYLDLDYDDYPGNPLMQDIQTD